MEEKANTVMGDHLGVWPNFSIGRILCTAPSFLLPDFFSLRFGRIFEFLKLSFDGILPIGRIFFSFGRILCSAKVKYLLAKKSYLIEFGFCRNWPNLEAHISFDGIFLLVDTK